MKQFNCMTKLNGKKHSIQWLSIFVLGFGALSANADVVNTPSHFKMDGTVSQTASFWNKMSSVALPLNSRNTTVFGKYLSSCPQAHDTNIKLSNGNYYPMCHNNSTERGPSFEGTSSSNEHIIHNEVPKLGTENVFITNFDSTGQNGSGGNKFILPIYTNFSIEQSPVDRVVMQPWGGNTTDFNRLRVAFISTQYVTKVKLPDPSNQQVQQNLRFVLLNKYCKRNTTLKCRLEFNLKAFLKGKYVSAHPEIKDASLFTDAVQGGMVAALIPFNSNGRTTYVNGLPIATSWGAPTQTIVHNQTMDLSGTYRLSGILPRLAMAKKISMLTRIRMEV